MTLSFPTVDTAETDLSTGPYAFVLNSFCGTQRSGKTYGPPSLKRLIYFVDDMNMPFIEEYGTQTPIALLRQYMDYRGWVAVNTLSVEN